MYSTNNNMRGRMDYSRSTTFGNTLQKPDWSKIKLQSFEKKFYVEHNDISRLSEEQVIKLRRDKEISVMNGKNIPKPIYSFDHIYFPDHIAKQIKSMNFESPTGIQCQSWPILLSGHDFIGIAETGSGKTLSFLLPGIVHTEAQNSVKPGEGPIVLILAPTRELVEQIYQESMKFVARYRTRMGVSYGGVPKRPQINEINRGVELLIGCPGRLIDFMESCILNLRRVTYLVLDEADRMLDMGFEPQIRKIVDQIRPDRQTVMLSATWPQEVKKLAHDLCREEPIHINIGSHTLSACKRIRQEVYIVQEQEKRDMIKKLLQEISSDGLKTLIFVETKKNADNLTWDLRNNGLPALAIHGDKKQEERTWVLSEFTRGNSTILVATDVASRGLDVKDIRYVINYDFPNQIEDYVHRIGRTGRAGAYGVSYTYFTPEDSRFARDFIQLLRQNDQTVPSELEKLCAVNSAMRSSRYNRGRGGNFRMRPSGGFSNRVGPYGMKSTGSNRRPLGGASPSGASRYGGSRMHSSGGHRAQHRNGYSTNNRPGYSNTFE